MNFRGIEKVEYLAKASKMSRLLSRPGRYVYAIAYRELIYKYSKKEIEKKCATFFGEKMFILLPSSTDIFLTGGKSHDSEIRLAKFIMRTLTGGSSFVDVGAHYGYFSLLAASLVGDEGKVVAIEAAPNTYRILDKNAAERSNITTHHVVVADSSSSMIFYEFPNLYSEYNTLDISQFKNEKWLSEYPPKEVSLEAVTLDHLLSSERMIPALIKIDVEGAEYRVLKGMEKLLTTESPIIVIEYLSDERSNSPHQKAENFLRSKDYVPHAIADDGSITPVGDVGKLLQERKRESDNIVFVKGV